MNAKNKNILVLVGTLVAGLLLGWLIFGGSSSEAAHEHAAEEGVETIWTCSMHPQIRAQEPGKCPICGMDLIPLGNNISEENMEAVQMTDYAIKLANIQTAEVGENSAGRELSLNGTVAVDERAVYTQATHIPGRIEQLLVNFTGEKVTRGQPLAVIYSPQLVTAQEELLQAYAIRESQPELFEAAKQKLRSWKIGENQINRILESGGASDRFTVTADVAGVVTEKLVELGDYVERGMPLYEIADLSKMWVLFDLYEKNMGWVEVGDTIQYKVASIPGETFTGTIDFIDPLIDRKTRVATARISVQNPEGVLKPEMFVSGVVTNEAPAASGQLSVPKSAVLWTGERSVVYVKEGTEGNPAFVAREVILGPSLGNAFVLKEGLSPGEEIVVNGAFTVDAAAQLAGKPSMMNPPTSQSAMGGMDMSGEEVQVETAAYVEADVVDFSSKIPAEFDRDMSRLVNVYLEMKEAYVTTEENNIKEAVEKFVSLLDEMEGANLSPEAKSFWLEKREFFLRHARINLEAETLEEKRENFVFISHVMIKVVEAFGAEKQLFVDYCPMAEAFWLSEVEPIRNPYMPEMLQCGEVVKTINK